MFKITFDKSDIERYSKEIEHVDINTEKFIRKFINQVYADVAKQHGKAFSYQTPPADTRTVLRKRSGDLLRELKESKFVDQNGQDEWEAGFDIKEGSILAVHEGSEDDSPTIISAKNGDYLVIPLKAALNGDGTPKVLSPRQFGSMRKFLIVPEVRKLPKGVKSGSKIIPVTVDQLNASGENLTKLQNSLVLGKWVGRKVVPYYLLAKHVSIPKRLFLNEAMSRRVDDLYDQLDKELERIVNGKS